MTVPPADGAAPAEQAGSRAPAPGPPARLGRRAAARLGRVTLAEWALLAAVALCTWHFTRLSLRIHHGLGTAAFDFGLFDQGMWLLSRFKAPFVTLMGRNLFGDHTSFILLPLVPLYWVHPGAGTLFFLQSAAIAAGSIPVFLYARRRLGNEAAALLLAVCFLLNPALNWANLEGFHPDAFLSVLLGLAIYAALTERWRTYVLFVVLVALVKEDTWLVLMPLGAWVALRRRPAIGLLTIAGSAVYPLALGPVLMAALTGVGVPNAWRIPFGGPSGLLTEMVKRPGNVASYLAGDGRPWYLWQMGAPFAWAFLRLPSVALIGVLVLGANILSTFAYQHQIGYHYSVVVVPALALGTVHALGAVKDRWRGRMLTAVLLMSVWSALLWGPLPFARTQPAYWAPDHPAAVAAREIMAYLPADASVSAHYGIAPHLAHREQIYMFPTPFRAYFYGPGSTLEGQRLPAADTVEYVLLPAKREPDIDKAWLAVPDDFTLIQANEWWELYRRTEPG
jgi:uncharacterized membrane protein